MGKPGACSDPHVQDGKLENYGAEAFLTSSTSKPALISHSEQGKEPCFIQPQEAPSRRSRRSGPAGYISKRGFTYLAKILSHVIKLNIL